MVSIEPKLLHLGYRLSKKTGGWPKPDDDVDEPDPEIFRKSFYSNNSICYHSCLSEYFYQSMLKGNNQ